MSLHPWREIRCDSEQREGMSRVTHSLLSHMTQPDSILGFKASWGDTMTPRALKVMDKTKWVYGIAFSVCIVFLLLVVYPPSWHGS